jgi:hypothetical protein
MYQSLLNGMAHEVIVNVDVLGAQMVFIVFGGRNSGHVLRYIVICE